jgi:hypothetical protein
MPSLSNNGKTAQARAIQGFLVNIGPRQGKPRPEKSDDFSNFMLHYADYDYSY